MPASAPTTEITPRNVVIEALNIDTSYQRRPARLRGEFNPVLGMGILVGERRNGQLYIVDGQRRVDLARRSGLTTLGVNVFRSEGVEHEARMFLAANNQRSQTGNQIVKARLAACDQDVVDMKAAIEAEGFTMFIGTGGNRVPRRISSVTTMLRLFEANRELFSETLRFINDAWGPDLDLYATKVHFLKGVYVFLKNALPQDSFNRSRAMTKCGTVSPRRIAQEFAVNGSSSFATDYGQANNVAEGLKQLYNFRLTAGRID